MSRYKLFRTHDSNVVLGKTIGEYGITLIKIEMLTAKFCKDIEESLIYPKNSVRYATFHNP